MRFYQQMHMIGFTPEFHEATTPFFQHIGEYYLQPGQHLAGNRFSPILNSKDNMNQAGTSEYAYDGSGRVKRDGRNWSWVTFATGKRYNADLNACYNIAARFFAKMLGLTGRNAQACVRGQSSATQPRIPVTLSTLWQYAQASVGEQEAPTTAPA